MLVIFFLAILVLSLAKATVSILTSQRRENEQEMVWRGKQYVRGIKLYYNKMHHYPAQLDDLYLPKTGIRFMRNAYKDPFNTVDGTWRLIYVTPDGRILGSTRNRQIQYLFATGWQSTGVTKEINTGSSGTGNVGDFPAAGPSTTTLNQNGPQSSPFSVNTQIGTTNSSQVATQDPLSPQPSTGTGTPPDDSLIPKTNSIIGIGSKINKDSFLWLDGEKNYIRFEFIYLPRNQ